MKRITKKMLQVNKVDCTGINLWEDTCIFDEEIFDCGDLLKEVWREDKSLGSECSDDDTFTKTYYERKYDIYDNGCVVVTDSTRKQQEKFSEDCVSDAGGHFVYKEEILCEDNDKYLYNYKYIQFNNGREIYTGDYTKTLLEKNSSYCVLIDTIWAIEGTICVGEALFNKEVEYNVYADGHRTLTGRERQGDIVMIKSKSCGADEDIFADDSLEWMTSDMICEDGDLYLQEQAYYVTENGEFIYYDIYRKTLFEENSSICEAEDFECGMLTCITTDGKPYGVYLAPYGGSGGLDYNIPSSILYDSGKPTKLDRVQDYYCLCFTYNDARNGNTYDYTEKIKEIVQLPCKLTSWLKGHKTATVPNSNLNPPSLFENLREVETINIKNIHFEFLSTFYDCVKLKRIIGIEDYLNNFDEIEWSWLYTPNLNFMFSNCHNLLPLDLRKWKDGIKKMSNGNDKFSFDAMFRYSKMPVTNMSGWDTSNVSSTIQMFEFNNNKNLDDYIGFKEWDLSGLKSAKRMFASSEFENIDLSNMKLGNTDSILDTEEMFASSKASVVKVGNPNYKTQMRLYRTFYNAQSTKEIYLNNIIFTYIKDTFYNCKSLETIIFDNSSFLGGDDDIDCSVFYKCNNLKRISMVNCHYIFVAAVKNALDCADINDVEIITTPTTEWFEEGEICENGNLYKVYRKYIDGVETDETKNELVEENSDKCVNNSFVVTTDGIWSSVSGNYQYLNDSTTYNFKLDRDNDFTFEFEYPLTSLNIPLQSSQESIISVTQFPNTTFITSFERLFYGAKNMTSINTQNISFKNCISANFMFYNCSKLQEIELNGTADMPLQTVNSMFYNCSSLTNAYLYDFYIDNLTSLTSMFNGCNKLEYVRLDLKGSGTSLTDISQMFNACSNLKSIDMNHNLACSSLTTTKNMFYGCSALTRLNLSLWNFLNLNDVSYMFSGCTSLEELNLGSATSNTNVNLQNMFYNCQSLKDISSLKNWHIKSSNSCIRLFYGCAALTSIDLSSIDFSACTDVRNMFDGCKALENIVLDGVDFSNVTFNSAMFSGCTSLQTIYARGCNQGTLDLINKMLDSANLTSQVTVVS